MSATLRALTLPFALACTVLPAQRQDPPKNSQRVAFVGDPGSPRTAAFVEFLRARFASAEAFPRDGADPQALRRHDVVLLDWPQSDQARQQRGAGWSPLGARESWRTPTVLLGSAGLNLAGSWQVRGGFG